MHIAFTDDMLALRDELRTYFASLVTEAERSSKDIFGRDRLMEIFGTLGRDGWLGIGWPVEYGGQGRSDLEQFVFFDEAKRAGVPIPMLALNTVGPTLMAYGTEEQKQRYLPAILRGEIDFAIGYTEPAAGTDLAALKTRAVRDGDEYVIDGNKIFTTGGAVSDYIWLAARTDPDAPKHKSLSIFIVPTDTPGFDVTPLPTIAEDGARATTSTYYSNVRVPVTNRVGAENEGWKLITTQLNHERVALAASRGWILGLAEEVGEWAATAEAPGGGRLIDVDWVRHTLAHVDARLEAMKLFNWRMVALVNGGGVLTAHDAAVSKVYGTEMLIEATSDLLEVLGHAGSLRTGSPAAVLSGRVESAYRGAVVGTFGGGNNDMLLEMISTSALGMTRAKR
ncbi:acyl-CoA dehydrogenase family protein [Nocardia jiangxiensis]|uniref:acyl-CoA dehydrogenase family protein n=1 Tax=Nocardia jiangxiensis TaxID=282685 RepID=UPI0002FE1DCD|nr:acyl-CoA dehydrogenase family protein [Nocardia jiangxiensis]